MHNVCYVYYVLNVELIIQTQAICSKSKDLVQRQRVLSHNYILDCVVLEDGLGMWRVWVRRGGRIGSWWETGGKETTGET